MDQQTCRVELSSFAYTADEVRKLNYFSLLMMRPTLSQVQYVWSGAVPVSVSELAINDYTFLSQTVGRSNITSKLGSKSSLYIEFTFSRTLGYYFMREIYPGTHKKRKIV